MRNDPMGRYQAPPQRILVDVSTDRRVLAYLIDLAIVYAVVFTAVFVIGFALTVALGSVPDSLVQVLEARGFTILILGFYHVSFWLAFGRTPGKMLLGIHIVLKANPQLGRLEIGAAVMRYLAYLACSFTFGIGFLLDWSNKIPGTRTVRVQTVPAASPHDTVLPSAYPTVSAGPSLLAPSPPVLPPAPPTWVVELRQPPKAPSLLRSTLLVLLGGGLALLALGAVACVGLLLVAASSASSTPTAVARQAYPTATPLPPLRNVNVPYAYPTPAPTPTPFQFLDSGRSRPVANTCPGAYPIKGNMSSMIYHAPGDEYYARTTPEICFANEEYAQRAGYRRARR